MHAGDIGSPEVLLALEAVVPVTAVRGNNDRGAWARLLPDKAVLVVGKVRLYVLHDVKALAVDPRSAALDAVIAGHSHKPSLAEQDGVLFLNPGSIAPPPLHAAGRDGILDRPRHRRARRDRVPRSVIDDACRALFGSGRGNAVLLARACST